MPTNFRTPKETVQTYPPSADNDLYQTKELTLNVISGLLHKREFGVLVLKSTPTYKLQEDWIPKPT